MTRTLIVLLLGGCATTADPVGADPNAGVPEAGSESGMTCRDEPLARYVGQVATAALGGEMLRASGARVLRWGPPGAMMTMDYRIDRLTVSYDRAYRITSARCG